MNEPTEPTEPTSDRRLSIERVGWTLLGLVVTLALLGGWWLVALVWSDIHGEDSVVFDVTVVAIAVAMLLITGAVIASLRYRRLRTALLPIEIGVVVGAGMVAVGQRGSEVDTWSDVVGIAIMFGIATAIILSFIALLLEGRRNRGRWMSGVAAVLLVLGISTPALLQQLEQASMTIDASAMSEMSTYELTSRITADGMLSLGSGTISARSATGVASPVSPIEGYAADGSVRLVADADDALRVRFTPKLEDAATSTIDLRAGTCLSSGALIDRWTVPNGRAAELRVTDTTAKDLDPARRLALRWGTGKPLDGVSCVDVAPPVAVLLALEGAATFAKECLAPLELTDRERLQMRPESFQDAGCASRMQALGDLAAGVTYRSEQRAREVGRCVHDADSGGTVRRLEHADAWLVVFDLPATLPSDPWVCLTTAGEQPLASAMAAIAPAVGYAATPGSAVMIDPATGLPSDPYAGVATTSDPAAAGPAPAVVSPIDVAP